jgi:L-cysteine S-thiosulfotransferase
VIRWAGVLSVFYCLLAGVAAAQTPDPSGTKPLSSEAGDAIRGRAIVANRQLGLCLLCHSGPIPEEKFQGTIAPTLAGTGSRWSTSELRQRVAFARTINPQTIMPSFYQSEGFTRVAGNRQGASILTGQQIEDVVAYLATLKD